MIKKITAKIQNFMYDIGSKKFKETQNKILFIGSYHQLGSIMKELKKNKNNIIIRCSTFIGRSLFRKDVDYFITSTGFDEDIKRILKKIDIIVVTNDTVPFENKVIKIANDMNIPSLMIQHGALGEVESFEPSITTKVAVWGELTKQWMINLRESQDKLIITGSPRYDEYITKKSEKKEKILKKFKISSSKKILLYPTHPFNMDISLSPSTRLSIEENKEILDKLFNVAKELSLFLVIKLHPTNEITIDEIYKLIPDIGYKDYIIIKHGQENLFNLINICDVFVTYTSTTALESMLLKKPIITVNFANKKDPMQYSRYGCAIQANDEETLKKALKEIINNKEVKDKLLNMGNKFIEKYCYKIDGLSSNRTAKLIMDMIKKEN